ncbi:MAG: DUF333 domain-containing protein [Bdellovibrionales bacterium]|nr:DUF333 domain-containing protein [Bdellovibrionales bacterium]
MTASGRWIGAWVLAAVGLGAGWADKPPGVPPAEVQRFQLDGKEQEFLYFKGEKLTLSRSCLKHNGERECEAFAALGRAVLRPEPRGGHSGNPGASLCGELGGVVVAGRDAKGNSNGFCAFGDGSSVDLGSLYQAAKNRGRKA